MVIVILVIMNVEKVLSRNVILCCECSEVNAEMIFSDILVVTIYA